jgi:hypothetical protein
MYGHVYYNAEMAEHRMNRGQEYEFEWAATGAEDAVIGINDADMLTSLGDLSPLMVELIDISKATHLTSLKVGDAADNYINDNLNSITLGNNALLKTMDFHNCTKLTQSVDASGCTGLEEAYFEGTAISGLSLPNGGNVKVLHLPDTITNFTLRNQSKLTDLSIPSYKNISTLWLEGNNDVVDPLAIFNEIPSGSRVRIIGFDCEMSNAELKAFLAKIDTMRGLDENGNNTDLAQVSGNLHIAELSPGMVATVEAAGTKYPSLVIVYDAVGVYEATKLVERTITEIERENITELPDYAFDGCNNLSVARFPNVTAIGYRAFGGCSALHDIDFSAASKIDRSGFASSLCGEVSFPSVTTIGVGAFSYTNATRINLPLLQNIPDSPFTYSRLEVLDFTALTSITGQILFINSPLKALIIRNTETVCSVTRTNAFHGASFASGKGYIYVPAALIDSYKCATHWSTVSSQFRDLQDYTVDGTVTGELDESKI